MSCDAEHRNQNKKKTNHTHTRSHHKKRNKTLQKSRLQKGRQSSTLTEYETLAMNTSDEQRLATSEQFPWKLHRLLDDAEKHGFESIVSWLPEGDAFKVHNRMRFASQIMPSYFSSTIYKSFQRNLTLWGFETVPSGKAKGDCSHPCFRRGSPDLCYNMNRIKIKGLQRRRAAANQTNQTSQTNITESNSILSSASRNHKYFECTAPSCVTVTPDQVARIIKDLNSSKGSTETTTEWRLLPLATA